MITQMIMKISIYCLLFFFFFFRLRFCRFWQSGSSTESSSISQSKWRAGADGKGKSTHAITGLSDLCDEISNSSFCSGFSLVFGLLISLFNTWFQCLIHPMVSVLSCEGFCSDSLFPLPLGEGYKIQSAGEVERLGMPLCWRHCERFVLSLPWSCVCLVPFPCSSHSQRILMGLLEGWLSIWKICFYLP